MFALNVDPRHDPPARPEPAELLRVGVDAVRLVSVPASAAWHEGALWAGLKTLAVVTEESGGYLLPGATWAQFGNEPDVAGHGDSLSPDEYVDLFRLYQQTYPNFTWVAAGLASGNAGWWQNVGPRLTGCSACCVHPYAKGVYDAKTLLRNYRSVRTDLGLWATEWNRPVAEVVPFARMLRLETDRAWWFCWSDAMVAGMGLVDGDGQPKEEMHHIKVA